MKIRFSRSEAEYIVNSSETDLLLTSVGMNLSECLSHNSRVIEMDASDDDIREFIDTLRDDYIWKVTRLPDPMQLNALAIRFLPNFDSLIKMNLG